MTPYLKIAFHSNKQKKILPVVYHIKKKHKKSCCQKYFLILTNHLNIREFQYQKSVSQFCFQKNLDAPFCDYYSSFWVSISYYDS